MHPPGDSLPLQALDGPASTPRARRPSTVSAPGGRLSSWQPERGRAASVALHQVGNKGTEAEQPRSSGL